MWMQTETAPNINANANYYDYKRKEIPIYFASFNLHTQGSFQDHINTQQRNDVRTVYKCAETA